ncbi:agmatine deiminase family protein [Alteromonas sp. ASW11-130]|uniref:agmatine deiminase family protein n=1 Tax=Alteromonas sp. ASW11-130 TaxID=3015775 RepID=UPI002241C20B|nr:agmatine deiminase family protein [Alteromonas sp. ASW11-130]MCW8090747.1 agmatine deiminase family protein [Alteromonas sp. ASW11-130]
MHQQLLPEWESLEAVILAWPHQNTDWAPWLNTARQTYLTLIDQINTAGVGVILLTSSDDVSDVQACLPLNAKVLILPAVFNDTWVRDYAFLTCHKEGENIPVEFRFNGWGNKFDAVEDNKVNQRYLFDLCRNEAIHSNIVAEGGALEINATGHLLSTSLCLLNPERNGDFSLDQYRDEFAAKLGATQITILEQGHLEGDDTDGHIDTLVRFTPNNSLIIQASYNRRDDSHFSSLDALCKECAVQLPNHRQFHLPLPAIYSADGDRLPASYANFLICNDHILLPVYQQPEDDLAISVMQLAYPHHTIVPVNCAILVQQYGSLHCISMQVPINTLKAEVVSQLNNGVSVYATQ